MLNFNRPPDAREGVKSPLKPPLYDPPGSTARPAGGTVRASTPASAPPRETAPPASATEIAKPASPQESTVTTTPVLTDAPGSKLFVGINIKLKGVEISDCDALVIEGEVEATVHSKLMQVTAPGTLKGNALIDVAEIQGEFAGELTARTRLVVHGTGRVSGTIRYGKLIVEEGGELTGDVKRLDAADSKSATLTGESRHAGSSKL